MNKKYIPVIILSLLILCSLIIVFVGSQNKKNISHSSNNKIDTPEQEESQPEIKNESDIIVDSSAEDEILSEDEEIEELTEDKSDEEEYIFELPTPNGDNSKKRVVCWGDSLTEGTGGDGVTMPNTLASLSGAEVLNYGVYADTTSCIAARQGANPQYTVEDIVIPADCTPVPAQVSGKYGYEMLLVFGSAGVNNVVLNGIEGIYVFDDAGNRCFTRLAPGEETFVPSGTQLFFHGMLDKKDDDILVIWAGGNDTPQSRDEIGPVLEKIDEIIAFQGSDKYIVLSDMNSHLRIPVTDEMNEAFSEHYGNHFLNLREYMMVNGLKRFEITPTEYDEIKISKGDLPASLLCSEEADEVHGNPKYYQIAGEQVYIKLQELGYLY